MLGNQSLEMRPERTVPCIGRGLNCFLQAAKELKSARPDGFFSIRTR